MALDIRKGGTLNRVMRTIGIIAGNGVYPETFARAARRQSEEIRLVCIAFDGETKPEFNEEVDAIKWIKVGQLGKLIDYFVKEGVKEAVMVGQIAPKNLYSFRPDLRTIKMLARLKERNAESMFGGIADEMAKDGINLLSAVTFLENDLAGEGHLFGPKPKDKMEEDAVYGFQIAKECSRLDIGQSVLVREGTVLAVEAFEGTNECIKRGGELGKRKNVTLAKVSKPNQDFRFDVPVIGPLTLETCKTAGVSQIVVESRCTLILEQKKVAELAKKYKITIFGKGA